MTTPQFYFLLLAIATFAAFAVSLGAACIRYRFWAKAQPVRRLR